MTRVTPWSCKRRCRVGPNDGPNRGEMSESPEHPEPPPPPAPGLVAPPRQTTVALSSPIASSFNAKSGPAPPPPPPAGFSGAVKSAPLEAAAKPAAAPTATPAAEGTQTAEGGLKHVYFDFDQTISTIHVFKQLAGWEPGVDAPHALSERGQIQRLKMLNADLQYNYQSSKGMVVPCGAGAKGSSWTACALGGLMFCKTWNVSLDMSFAVVRVLQHELGDHPLSFLVLMGASACLRAHISWRFPAFALDRLAHQAHLSSKKRYRRSDEC